MFSTVKLIRNSEDIVGESILWDEELQTLFLVVKLAKIFEKPDHRPLRNLSVKYDARRLVDSIRNRKFFFAVASVRPLSVSETTRPVIFAKLISIFKTPTP